jgi:hypothetical protein
MTDGIPCPECGRPVALELEEGFLWDERKIIVCELENNKMIHVDPDGADVQRVVRDE